MLTYFRIDSEEQLEWIDDPQDLLIFIVVIATVQHEFGISTYLLSNGMNKRGTMASKQIQGVRVMHSKGCVTV